MPLKSEKGEKDTVTFCPVQGDGSECLSLWPVSLARVAFWPQPRENDGGES